MDDLDPPCEGCPWDEIEIHPANVAVWRLWVTAHEMGREGWSGRMRIEALTAYARAGGATRQDLEDAIDLERHLWPMLKPPEENEDGRTEERR